MYSFQKWHKLWGPWSFTIFTWPRTFRFGFSWSYFLGYIGIYFACWELHFLNETWRQNWPSQ